MKDHKLRETLLLRGIINKNEEYSIWSIAEDFTTKTKLEKKLHEINERLDSQTNSIRNLNRKIEVLLEHLSLEMEYVGDWVIKTNDTKK